MRPILLDITDKVVIVTGAAGQLGSEWCRYLRHEGARVAEWDLRTEHSVDITRRDSVLEALARTAKSLGHPDALICAAGIDRPPDARDANLSAVIDVNLIGAHHCCEIVGEDMAEHGGGSIVTIGSVYGMVGPDQRIYREGFLKPAAYSMSKAGLYGLTRWHATRWADKGVRANTLTLGGVQHRQSAEFVDFYSSRVPMGRMAQVDEYNGAIAFLVSDASKYMTGANLVIDGGLTAW